MIEFDLKECISFVLGVIKRFLVLHSVFVLSEELDPFFFFSPLQKYLSAHLRNFLKPWLGLFGPRCFQNDRSEPGYSFFSLYLFLFYTLIVFMNSSVTVSFLGALNILFAKVLHRVPESFL